MPINAREIGEALKGFRAQKIQDPSAAHKNAIAYLENCLASADSEEDLAYLYQSIAREHSRYMCVDDAERTWLEVIKKFPNDPLSWIHASNFYMIERSNPSKALILAGKGSEAAEALGQFVVHSYNQQCRAAKELADYETMTRVITKLLSHKHLSQSMDSAYECDFLIGLPENAISTDLVDGVQKLCDRSS